MVPTAIDFAVLVEVYKIHQQFLTGAADKATRMPTLSGPCPGSKNYDFPSVYLTTTLLMRKRKERRKETTGENEMKEDKGRNSQVVI